MIFVVTTVGFVVTSNILTGYQAYYPWLPRPVFVVTRKLAVVATKSMLIYENSSNP